MKKRLDFCEFFSGGGLARLGLAENWNCVFANDISSMKGEIYNKNFSNESNLLIEDIRKIKAIDINKNPILAWASFPCQDLSLAGNGKGINGERSSTFWDFWRIINEFKDEKRTVPIVVIENVPGLLTSGKGKDFNSLLSSIVSSGYYVGAIIIDARYFVPQSRKRLFIVAIKKEILIPELIQTSEFSDKLILSAFNNLDENIKSNWIWWNLPMPESSTIELKNIIEKEPSGISWHSDSETNKIIKKMSPINYNKVVVAQKNEEETIGTIYFRTRTSNGKRRVFAEVRVDGLSGCLRTPAGGSSRQTLIFISKKRIKTRLISPREIARLMGVDDNYILPNKYNDTYHLMGDAVVVQAVRWLDEKLLQPIVGVFSQDNVEISECQLINQSSHANYPIPQENLSNNTQKILEKKPIRLETMV